MTKETVRDVILVMLFSAVLILTWITSWAIGWQTGYKHGHKVANVYYNTTGELPSQSWIDDRENWHNDRKYLILDSLEKEE